jgi:hypothetical protein
VTDMRSNRLTAGAGTLAAALALAASLTACGNDEDRKAALSKNDYIARSAAICIENGKKAEMAYAELVEGAPRTAATAQRFLKEAVVPLIEDSVSKRARLAAPKGDEKEIAALRAAGERALARFKWAARQPTRSLALMRGTIKDPATEYDARSRRYGIAKCGGDQ